ncbi:hypothetical protein [Duganella levis]|uniref:Uncharacterized protein n=1 Tax=Duganella levis TaxID=2692169 RepID=A0ABW9VZK6_9BURK|nr:hypothetical protein [Duganella levis]MYN26969.1 hypothetical protein [Duganella levis]
MQNIHSTPDTQHQVDTFLASLPLDGSVAAAELIRAIKTNELTPNLVPAVAGFLANAPATLLATLLIAPGASAADIENTISSAVALADKVHCERSSTLEVEIKRALIPSDFPAQPQAASISGAQPKIALVSYGGKYYEPGTSPPEVLARWELCEDLANQFVERCLLNEKGKYAHLSRQEILQQYLARLLRTGWGSDTDMMWVINRTAALLSWEPINVLSDETQRLHPNEVGKD